MIFGFPLRRFFFVLYFLLFLSLFVYAIRLIDLAEPLALLRTVRLPFLFASFGMMVFLIFIKAVQWKFFFPSFSVVSFGFILGFSAVRLLGVHLLPFWSGEAFSIYFLGRRAEFSKMNVLSAATQDHIAEGFSVGILFVIVSFSPILPHPMRQAIHVALPALLVLFSGLFFLARFYSSFEGHRAEVPKSFLKKMVYYFSVWANQLNVMKNFKTTPVTFLLAVLVKGVEVMVLHLLQKGLGMGDSWWAPLLGIVGLNLSLAFPVAPAQLGVFEATVFGIYSFLGFETDASISLGGLYHLIYLLPLVLAGGVFLIFSRLRQKEHPHELQKNT